MKRGWLSQLGYGLLGVVVLLSAFGLVVLWSASHGPDGAVAGYAVRQARWMALGWLALGLVLAVDYRHLDTYAVPLFSALVLLLVLVLVTGRASMGAQRWLAVGPLRVQPSEFMKIGVGVMIAHVLSREPSPPPYGLRQLWLPAVLTAVPVGLILLQPDLGTSLLVASGPGLAQRRVGRPGTGLGTRLGQRTHPGAAQPPAVVGRCGTRQLPGSGGGRQLVRGRSLLQVADRAVAGCRLPVASLARREIGGSGGETGDPRGGVADGGRVGAGCPRHRRARIPLGE